MSHRSRTVGSAESGHLLVGLMVLVAVILILLTVTAQSWVFITRRDNEAEVIFRGEEYARALAFYKAETGNYPLELKALMQRGPHRHRFIRRLYKDPLSDDGKWGQLYLSPTGKGFINPYASRVDTRDPFGGGVAGRPSGLRSNSGVENSSRLDRTGDAFRQARDRLRTGDEEAPGYSEMTSEEFQARGGEQQGLPIVGVVHKKKESGLKIYKNQANLNDWAFTLLLEGQQTMGSPATAMESPHVPLQKGIGDAASPFMLHGEPAPGPDLGPLERRRKEALAAAKEKANEGGDQQDENQDDEYRDDTDTDTDEPEDYNPPEEEPPPEEDPNEPSGQGFTLLP